MHVKFDDDSIAFLWRGEAKCPVLTSLKESSHKIDPSVQIMQQLFDPVSVGKLCQSVFVSVSVPPCSHLQPTNTISWLSEKLYNIKTRSCRDEKEGPHILILHAGCSQLDQESKRLNGSVHFVGK